MRFEPQPESYESDTLTTRPFPPTADVNYKYTFGAKNLVVDGEKNDAAFRRFNVFHDSNRQTYKQSKFQRINYGVLYIHRGTLKRLIN